jgi:hypothetical protein
VSRRPLSLLPFTPRRAHRYVWGQETRAVHLEAGVQAWGHGERTYTRGQRGSSSITLQMPTPGADSLTPSVLSGQPGRGAGRGHRPIASHRRPRTSQWRRGGRVNSNANSSLYVPRKGTRLQIQINAVRRRRSALGARGRGPGGGGVAWAVRAPPRGVWAGPSGGGRSSSGSGLLPPGRGPLLSMASGSGPGAAASANLNAVRETMDGECASFSSDRACASRRRAPGWRRRRGPHGPRVGLGGILRGDGEGDPPRPRSWRPQSSGLPLRRSLARAGRSRPRDRCLRAHPGATRPAKCLAPARVWRVLVAWGPGAKGVVDLFVHAVSSVPGPRRFSNGLFVSSD